MRERNLLNQSPIDSNLSKQASTEPDLTNAKELGRTILQPIMRYTPRTDLERIIDSINSNTYRQAYNDLLSQQLNELHLLKEVEVHNIKETDGSEVMNNNIKERNSSNDSERNKVEVVCQSDLKKTKKRIAVNNSYAKHLLSELHNKTHFKGATHFTLKNEAYFKNQDSQRGGTKLDSKRQAVAKEKISKLFMKIGRRKKRRKEKNILGS